MKARHYNITEDGFIKNPADYYVQVFIDIKTRYDRKATTDHDLVFVGWATGEELKQVRQTYDQYAGFWKHDIPVKNLHPMKDFPVTDIAENLISNMNGNNVLKF